MGVQVPPPAPPLSSVRPSTTTRTLPFRASIEPIVSGRIHRFAVGMPEWAWGSLMSEKCNKLLATTRLRGKALHTFVCRSALQRRTKRAEAAQSGARMVPSWSKHVRVVRAGGLEPPRPVRVCGFSYHFGFRRLARRVRGLDYPFTSPRERLRCCPSSLYTFPKTSGLGSGLPFKVSPTLSSSTPPVSQTGTQFP